MALSTEDTLAVNRLYAEYNDRFDHGTTDEFVALWSVDGELVTTGGGSKGHDRLASGMVKIRERMPKMRHGTMNVIVDGDRSEATGSCYLLIYQTTDAGLTLLMSGRYQDTLRFDGARWVFVRRVMTAD